MADSAFGVFFNRLNRAFMAAVTCTVALGGATVGTITGAIKGPTTETGLVRGACERAITGAITAMQLMEKIVDGEPFCKVSGTECGRSKNKLPRCIFRNSCKEIERDGSHESSCAICLRCFKNREEGRELPICKHVFHLECIDEWLIRSSSCPICRRDVYCLGTGSIKYEN